MSAADAKTYATLENMEMDAPLVLPEPEVVDITRDEEEDIPVVDLTQDEIMKVSV